MAICKYLDLSTAHITYGDNMRLTSGGGVGVRCCSHDHGFIVFINSEYAREDIEASGLSIDFLNVYLYAIKNGCDLVNFDSDGEIIDGLAVNNW